MYAQARRRRALSHRLAAFVISKKAADELGDEEADRLGVGTGPFEFVGSAAGQFWKFKAVEEH